MSSFKPIRTSTFRTSIKMFDADGYGERDQRVHWAKENVDNWSRCGLCIIRGFTTHDLEAVTCARCRFVAVQEAAERLGATADSGARQT